MSERHSFKVVAFVLLEKDGKIFMLRRFNTRWADGMWTIPSGHVEKGEGVREAAIKEVREEAGVSVKSEDLEFLHVHAVADAYVNFYFKATSWEGEAHLAEKDMCSEVAWIARNELPADTILMVRSLIKNMQNGNYFSEIVNDPNASE